MPVFLDPARAYPESGLLFDPPHDQCFRFDQCEPVKRLKGLGLHEMDFAWWDDARKAMHLLEVKDYSLPQAKIAQEHLVNECVQKATDCLLLLASVWHDLPLGPEIRAQIPEPWHQKPNRPKTLNMFFVFKVPESSRGAVARDPVAWDALEATARNRLNGRRELFLLRAAAEVFLMDHLAAAGRGLPIKTEEALVGPSRKGKGR